jgi:hypothetical protein
VLTVLRQREHVAARVEPSETAAASPAPVDRSDAPPTKPARKSKKKDEISAAVASEHPVGSEKSKPNEPSRKKKSEAKSR